MTQQHPFFPYDKKASPKTYSNIFSFGDVCLTPSNELKSVVSIMQYQDVVAKNVFIQALAAEKRKEGDSSGAAAVEF